MKQLFLIAFSFVLFIGCNSSDDKPKPDPTNYDFDRKAMIENWANQIIVPAYTGYSNELNKMGIALQDFKADPNIENLETLRDSHRSSYIAWEKCAFFEVGPAKVENLRIFTNTYPTKVEQINQLVNDTDYQLHLESNKAKQGLPALDYLINGIANSEDDIVNFYLSNEGTKYLDFSEALIIRLQTKIENVLSEWAAGYKNTFINNSNSSASGSIDLIANDYMLYYEKFMRNGKVRIPVGFTNNVSNPEMVEAYYSEDLGKELLKTSVESLRNFYTGQSFSGNSDGLGFKDYLIKLDKSNVSTLIDENFDVIISHINDLPENLAVAVVQNRESVLNLQDEIQKSVNNLKVDMFQSLGIVVAYYDGDGD